MTTNDPIIKSQEIMILRELIEEMQRKVQLARTSGSGNATLREMKYRDRVRFLERLLEERKTR